MDPDEIPSEADRVGQATAYLQACRTAIGEAPRRFDDAEEMAYLSPTPPSWVTPEEPFNRYFEDRPRVLRDGRVVWAAMIQANDNLFRPGAEDHPAELLYSAAGAIEDPAVLVDAAGRLFDLKDTAPEEDDLAPLAHHLTDEMQRVFGLDAPQRLTGGVDLEVTSVFFHRTHLPSGYLRRSLVPILVAPPPRLVMVLPERYWPAGLVEWWEAGWTASPANRSGWFGTIIGALHNDDRVDVVVDAGQVLVLHGVQTRDSVSARLAELKSADAVALVAADPRNRRFDEAVIEQVAVSKKHRLTQKERMPGTLTIRTVDGEVFTLRLVDASLIVLARRLFSRMLGPRFAG